MRERGIEWAITITTLSIKREGGIGMAFRGIALQIFFFSMSGKGDKTKLLQKAVQNYTLGKVGSMNYDTGNAQLWDVMTIKLRVT